MADEEIQEEIQDEPAEEDQKEAKDEAVEAVNPDKERAMRNGWRPKDEWSGDPDDFVSAKKFNERGEMIGQIRNLTTQLNQAKTDFSGRLDSHKKLQEAQMKVTITDLESRRDDAIDQADRDKANTIQGQIDEVKSTVIPIPVDNRQAALDDWNTNNTWITEPTPKAAFGKERFNFHEKTMSPESAITAMEADIEREFPAVNPRRSQAPTVEGGRSKPGAKVSTKLSWTQLNAHELKCYDAMPNAWKTKDEFLQAVQDERNA